MPLAMEQGNKAKATRQPPWAERVQLPLEEPALPTHSIHTTQHVAVKETKHFYIF